MVCIRFQKTLELSVYRACYVAMPLYICGFLTLGAGIQHLNAGALIMGWGIALVAITVNTVAVCEFRVG